MTNANLSELRQVRRMRWERLQRLPNVLGTGLGVKRRAGAKVASAALVVFVERKYSVNKIGKERLIPRYVVHKGRHIPTDVVEINGVRPEFGEPPYFLSDFATKGVVAAFARAEGQFHVVSCAHCLEGQDGDPHTISPIGLWDPDQGKYIQVGQTVFAVDSPGFGITGNFGFVDAGFAILEDTTMVQRARSAPPLAIGVTRRGISVIGRGPGIPVRGVIDAVEVVISDRRTDMLILMNGVGSFPGHSGMMWRTNTGQAIAMHAYGAHFQPDGSSRYSLAMSTSRVAKQLQIELFDSG